MKLTLLRHATLVVELAGKKILIDPMLCVKEAMEPVQNASNQLRIPMTPLPLTANQLTKLIDSVDAVLITHTHRDHWDEAAQNLIPKSKHLFCQPQDEEKLREQGFSKVHAVSDEFKWDEVTINRTGGQHGTGEIGKKMGPVSGFVLQANDQTMYLAGDTIWCAEVQEALATYKPGVVVVNAGAAQFLQGDPITMTADDVRHVIQAAPASKVVAVHMDTVNHCHLTRTKLRAYLTENKLANKCLIPEDGQTLSYAV
ncbi:MBL fold metallo-hydrolase [Pontibacter sp. MBLB2868]|uniref:MBL fold metallo-hydrolase n=1 Tax=Pontibacter sp. MBLB2868 TaxID=3451555 RepID=UPI003F751C94